MTRDRGHGTSEHPPPSGAWAPPGGAPGQPPPGHRPGFLPPDEGFGTSPGAPHGTPRELPREPRQEGRAGVWGLATIAAAVLLLLSAFLPWVRARLVISGFGQTLSHEVAREAGVNVDGTGQLVPVFAALAIAMTGWGLLARSPRIAALAAAPGLLALLCCAMFMLRLGRFKDEIGGGRTAFGAVEITTGYGWFLALAAALLVTGLSLAGPLIRRAGRRP